MGYATSKLKETCDEITAYVNNPANQGLDYDALVLAVKNIIMNAEKGSESSSIHRSFWFQDETNKNILGSYLDTHHNAVNLIVDWLAPVGDKGGCKLTIGSATIESPSIKFFSQHFRPNVTQSTNIDGKLTFFRSPSSNNSSSNNLSSNNNISINSCENKCKCRDGKSSKSNQSKSHNDRKRSVHHKCQSDHYH